ncbi:MAG: type IV pilin protein [Candidatus Binatia bacterium]
MIHKLILHDEVGFTLIEMLTIVAIMGILLGIAVPQFVAYRKKSYEAQVKSDLRNAAAAEEAYFADKDAYQSGPLTSGSPLQPGVGLRKLDLRIP